MATESAPARRAHRVLAGCLAGLALAEIVTTIAATLAAHASFADPVGAFLVTNGAMGLTFPVCGGLLAWHRPRNPIGWLLLAAGLGMATSAAAGALCLLGAVSGWNTGTLRALATLFLYAWPWTIALFLPVALLLFPDGHPAGPRWRWVIRAAAVNSVVFVASLASPEPLTAAAKPILGYLIVPGYDQLSAL